MDINKIVLELISNRNTYIGIINEYTNPDMLNSLCLELISIKQKILKQ